ncbi:hypothetical protein [Zunongwangia atlantica]|uniref:RiboL-PSP-HEPN domain-containing protein n=1 Tax=Zunongwangia atlantica 22II14-10F7 TaxID=1185767 RepID=A0A1Y1SYJ9_9FLAO|nr:hypothetical protein [Zunongwangia atlantica]ORL43474.1 hypothetical protein IIF7_20631 [Zunongwangia atlantica 22II14-10F7]
MPFQEEIKQEIQEYITKHLPEENWFEGFFDFIDDDKLRERLSEEFKAIRYIYKFFEGIQADDWLKNAQIRIQIFYYASIYEAIIHHILFELLANEPEVRKLFETKTYKKISVSKKLNELEHDGKKILTMYKTTVKREITTIRFEDKIDASVKLNLIDSNLGEELKEIYKLRNAIHLHAEIKKGIEYEVEMSKIAYRRMQIFREQIIEGLNKYSVT